MPLKKLLIATLFSLPWVPFVLLPVDQLNNDISLSSMLLATPFILEFFGFYMLHGLTKSRSGTYTKSEQKYLLILIVCLFVMFAIPVVIVTLTGADPAILKISVVLGLTYALWSLVANTLHIRQSSSKINRYFLQRYVLPASIAIGFFVLITFIPSATLTINVLAAYYIAKNFLVVSALEKA